MSNVLEVLLSADFGVIQTLADELDETLSNIAYAGMAEDKDYIRHEQRYFQEKYGELIGELDKYSDLIESIDCILAAYYTLNTFLDIVGDTKWIEEEAENAVQEYLIWPDGMELIEVEDECGFSVFHPS